MIIDISTFINPGYQRLGYCNSPTPPDLLLEITNNDGFIRNDSQLVAFIVV